MKIMYVSFPTFTGPPVASDKERVEGKSLYLHTKMLNVPEQEH